MDTTAWAALIGATMTAIPAVVTVVVLIFRHGRTMAKMQADIDTCKHKYAPLQEHVILRQTVAAHTALHTKQEEDLSNAKKKIWTAIENRR